MRGKTGRELNNNDPLDSNITTKKRRKEKKKRKRRL